MPAPTSCGACWTSKVGASVRRDPPREIDKRLTFHSNASRLLVFVRSDARCPDNPALVGIVLRSLRECHGNVDLRTAFADAGLHAPFRLAAACGVGYEEATRRCEAFRGFLVDAFARLLHLLQTQQWDEATDLADAIHFLPEIVAEGHLDDRKGFWKMYVRTYQRRWCTKCFHVHRGLFRRSG